MLSELPAVDILFLPSSCYRTGADMRVVLLAGGKGTRLQEETVARPKPMVEIGGKPILWHIMKHYAFYRHTEFYIALGYLGEHIKNYFVAQHNLSGDLSIDFAKGVVQSEKPRFENWTVHLVDTGSETLTGGRLGQLQSRVGDDSFLLTYGDGVSDINLEELVTFHKKQGRVATVAAVRPPARFGGLVIDDGLVKSFTEKPAAGEGWINGGFMVLEPDIFQYIHGDQCSLESDVLESVAADGQLAAYRHYGFWQCMDTLRDKLYLEREWSKGVAMWDTWSLKERPAGQRPHAA